MSPTQAKKKAKKLNVLDKVILGLNILCATALLMSYLAPGTNPLDFMLIAILGFGYLPLVIANLLFILYWLVRKRILMSISAVCLLLGFSFVSSFYGFHKAQTLAKKDSAESLRIMHYNVREFKGIDRFTGELIESEVLDIAADVQPDIIDLVEYRQRKTNRDSVRNSLLGIVRSNNYFIKAFKVTRSDSTGNAIFSKYPIINSGVIDTGETLSTKAIFADLKYKGKTIRVYCIHLAAVVIKGREKGKYLKGDVGIDEFSTILGKASGAFVSRSYQVAKIKQHIEKCPYPYIITGDFNDTPISYAVNELGDGLKNAFIEKGSGFQTTYFSGFPLQIDYIMASRQFDVLSYIAINKKLSDHKPVISDLKLKP